MFLKESSLKLHIQKVELYPNVWLWKHKRSVRWNLFETNSKHCSTIKTAREALNTQAELWEGGDSCDCNSMSDEWGTTRSLSMNLWLTFCWPTVWISLLRDSQNDQSLTELITWWVQIHWDHRQKHVRGFSYRCPQDHKSFPAIEEAPAGHRDAPVSASPSRPRRQVELLYGLRLTHLHVNQSLFSVTAILLQNMTLLTD